MTHYQSVHITLYASNANTTPLTERRKDTILPHTYRNTRTSAAAATPAAAPPPLQQVLLVRGRTEAAFLRTARLVGGRFVADAAVHHDPVRVVRRLLAGRLVQDRLRQLAERLLDVDVRLGGRLHEADVVLAGDLQLEEVVRTVSAKRKSMQLTLSPRSWLTTRLSVISHLLPRIIFSTSSLAC